MAATERRGMMLHINKHSHATHRLFGMDGVGRSFNCAHCDRFVQNRLPVRSGMDNSAFYCSMPCAKTSRVDKMDLSAMMMHNQTQGHEVHLTSGEGWFCTTCDYDLVAIMEEDND